MSAHTKKASSTSARDRVRNKRPDDMNDEEFLAYQGLSLFDHRPLTCQPARDDGAGSRKTRPRTGEGQRPDVHAH